jgi:hypothetical protein
MLWQWKAGVFCLKFSCSSHAKLVLSELSFQFTKWQTLLNNTPYQTHLLQINEEARIAAPMSDSGRRSMSSDTCFKSMKKQGFQLHYQILVEDERSMSPVSDPVSWCGEQTNF